MKEILNFNVRTRDVFNPTAPFLDSDRTIIAARVRERKSRESQVWFFKEESGGWKCISGAPVFDLEDPAITRIDRRLVFSGVEVDWARGTYRTIFYLGENIVSLRKFAEGPRGMKDIRLIQLPDKKIGIFTRSQGETQMEGGRGKIGFVILNDLSKLTAASLLSAPLIFDQFGEDRWGGANEVYTLANGLLGVLGHIASFEANGRKRYSAMAFTFDILSKKSSRLKIIARREDFPLSDYKNEDVSLVVFPGGLKMNGKTALLYAGLGDSKVGCLQIPNPFLTDPGP